MRLSLEQRLSALVPGAIVLCLIFCANASAQTVNSTVTGVVRDTAGAVIPGAKVALTDAATKLSVNTTTNGEGFYLFNDIRSGYYSVAVEATGFKKSEIRDVKVDVGVPATVNVNLEAGQIAEVVTTTASDSQAVVNTENAELTATVFRKQINDLPLNGRNPVQLASLQAGVASTGAMRNSTINGMRGSFNNITWDGINIQENYLRGNASSGLFAQAAPSVVGVSEFTIVTQNAGAADGTGAAQVKLVTPRGSTNFHGQLFEFHRNDAIDANTFFNNAAGLDKEKLIQNQFGFELGGPIKLPKKVFGPLGFDTNKLFFYAYDEETRDAETTGLTRTVLYPAARQGIFSYRATTNNTDPAKGPVNGQLMTINLLQLAPQLQVDPIIQSQLAMTLTPNDPTAAAGDRINTGAFRFNSPAGSTTRLWGFRIDYNLSERHRFEAIHSNNSNNFPNDTFNNTGEPFPRLPGVGQFPRRKHWSFAWNWTATPTISNEVRGGTYRQISRFLNSTEFPEGYVLTWPTIGGTAAVTNPVRTNQDSGRDGNITDFADNASWVKGGHILRFGGNFRHVQLIPFSFAGKLPGYTIGFGQGRNPLSSGNQLQFPGGISTNDFANAGNLLALLTGTLRTAAQTFNVVDANSGYVAGAPQRRDLRYYALGFYVGDTWRFRPNLTLNIGLRHDYYDPVHEVNGIGLLPKGGLEGLRDPNLVLELAGGGKGTQTFYKSDKNNFAPNFSFSWDPFKDGKTAIRGGYSISYVLDSPIQTAENALIDGNDGLTSAVTVPNINTTVSGNRQSIATPVFKVPRTLKDQQAINQNPTVFTIDPNLRTPYVQQWNIGIEREIFRDTAIEIRYVGNRGIKLTRGVDINQVVIFGNGFLDDFKRAQGNLLASDAERARQTAAGVPTAQRVASSPAFNSAVPGSQLLTIFPQIGFGGFYADATRTGLDSNIVNLIRQGQVGEVVQTYLSNSRATYLTPGTNGAVLSPGFFLRANPEAGAVDLISNGSFSNYNALQAEIRRRLRNGVYFQANYTWSKGFTDFDGSDSNFSALLDLEKGVALEKKRITNDITHIFKANGIYELPFGPGKRWMQGGVASRVLGGWQINSIFEARTGRPISFTSNRGTVNRQGRSAKNTVVTSLSREDLQDKTGLFFDPATGRPLFVDPSLIGADGRANPQFLQNPNPGEYGSLQLTPVSGPGYWNVDLSLIKRTKIKESWNLEFRAEAFNAFNHTNFSVSAESNDINSTTFGRLTTTVDPRILQLALKLQF